jgi:hypothetical protein
MLYPEKFTHISARPNKHHQPHTYGIEQLATRAMVPVIPRRKMKALLPAVPNHWKIIRRIEMTTQAMAYRNCDISSASLLIVALAHSPFSGCGR